jgi:alpha-glucosidase (family GH31 glycosyl hydrolase)
MDYSLRTAQQTAKTGLPLVRPMFVAEPKEAQSWDRWQQFFYGNDILVGVIWQKGQSSFPMFLPQGKWVDAWSGKEFNGPTTVTVEAPLYKIPLFLRRNARGLLGDLNAEWAAAQRP